MKKSDLYEITIKILGIYLFFRSIDLFRDVLIAFTISTQVRQNIKNVVGDFDTIPFFILSIVNFTLAIIFAAILTFKTKVIVKFVCSAKDYEETSSLFADRRVIYEVALVLMGLLLFVWTLPDFIIKLKNHIQLVQNNMQTEVYDNQFIITSAIKIFVGLIAIIYAKSISSILIKHNKTNVQTA